MHVPAVSPTRVEMFDASFFANPDALAKLAALNPLVEPAEGSSSAAHGRAEGKRTVASSGKDVVGAERIGGEFQKETDAAWLKSRDSLLQAVVDRTKQALDKLEKSPIKVTLPDGKVCDGTAWVTSPLDIATSISKGLAQAVCVASVKYSSRLDGGAMGKVVEMSMDGEEPVAEVSTEWEMWDANRPLEGDCELQLIKFEDPRGKEVFWHSSAHILGEALEGAHPAGAFPNAHRPAPTCSLAHISSPPVPAPLRLHPCACTPLPAPLRLHPFTCGLRPPHPPVPHCPQVCTAQS